MSISDIRCHQTRLPLNHPLRNATVEITGFTILLVDVVDENGLCGEGIAFTIDPRQMPAVVSSVELFRDAFLGSDPNDVTGTYEKCLRRLGFLGMSGAPIHALSAIEGAVWDLRGKRTGSSIASLLGRSRTAVPVYASQGLWTNQDTPDLVRQAATFVDAGYRGMKLRLTNDLSADIPRIAAIRRQIGDDIQLMVDANQGMSYRQALRFVEHAAEFDLEWFEEPFRPHEIGALRDLRSKSAIPIASGESDYTRFGCQKLLDEHAVDILMPDLQRVGGVSDFIAVCAASAANAVPISSHLFPEMSLQIMAHARCVHSLEMVDWFSPLFSEQIELDEGYATVPSRPGWGFTVNRSLFDI